MAELLGRPVTFAEDSVGEAAASAIAKAGPGGVVLLENLRFHAEEEKNDAVFAQQLAALADVYVNDAFGSAHRAHASTEGIVHHIGESAAGLLMAKEVEYLGRVLEHPDRPFVAILGGAKVSDKLEVIENLIPRVDALLIGGAMAYTFFKAQGLPVGKSLVEADLLDTARDVERRAKERGLRFELPTDHVVAPKLEAGAPAETLAVGDPAIGERMGLDIGPRTVQSYREVIAGAKTVIWNGPMGVFEIDAFANGTLEVARGRRLGQGDDGDWRRRLDRGGGEGGGHRPHHPHLHRRRRVARVPGWTQTAGGGGAEVAASFQPPASRLKLEGLAGSWKPELEADICESLSSPRIGRCTRPCTSRSCSSKSSAAW